MPRSRQAGRKLWRRFRKPGATEGRAPKIGKSAEEPNVDLAERRSAERARMRKNCNVFGPELMRFAGPHARALGTRRARSEWMTKPIPTIQHYMTTSPHSIGVDQTLAHAHKVMREHKIRHLPVLVGGKLVGMVTERDLHLVETLRDVDPKSVKVEDAMAATVYSVSPDAPLDEVVSEMAQNKYGSAVVLQNGKVVGIFTTVDVCRTLAELLHSRLSK